MRGCRRGAIAAEPRGAGAGDGGNDPGNGVHSPDALARAIARMLEDDPYAADCAARGIARARRFDWAMTARRVSDAYLQAIEHRRCASA